MKTYANCSKLERTASLVGSELLVLTLLILYLIHLPSLHIEMLFINLNDLYECLQ